MSDVARILKEARDQGRLTPLDFAKENFDDFIILSIFANPAIRFKRLQQRNREDDSENYEDFLKRDQMELDFGIGTVISLSDKIIINEKDLESYEKEINEFLKENTTL